MWLRLGPGIQLFDIPNRDRRRREGSQLYWISTLLAERNGVTCRANLKVREQQFVCLMGSSWRVTRPRKASSCASLGHSGSALVSGSGAGGKVRTRPARACPQILIVTTAASMTRSSRTIMELGRRGRGCDRDLVGRWRASSSRIRSISSQIGCGVSHSACGGRIIASCRAQPHE